MKHKKFRSIGVNAVNPRKFLGNNSGNSFKKQTLSKPKSDTVNSVKKGD